MSIQKIAEAPESNKVDSYAPQASQEPGDKKLLENIDKKLDVILKSLQQGVSHEKN